MKTTPFMRTALMILALNVAEGFDIQAMQPQSSHVVPYTFGERSTDMVKGGIQTAAGLGLTMVCLPHSVTGVLIGGLLLPVTWPYVILRGGGIIGGLALAAYGTQNIMNAYKGRREPQHFVKNYIAIARRVIFS
jgi:hypothetical protein